MNLYDKRRQSMAPRARPAREYSLNCPKTRQLAYKANIIWAQAGRGSRASVWRRMMNPSHLL